MSSDFCCGTALSFYVCEEARERGISFSAPRPLDAGYDLPSLFDVSLSAGERRLIRTGIHIAVPEGWVGVIKDRSSVASRGGEISAGVIDSAYRGEVKVLMRNAGAEELTFKSGDRIAQLLVLLHSPGNEVVEVSSLEDLGVTLRGEGGFGSTGR
ncbi:MAG: dUTP diphosphatase [Deltaproteobacteria bacterium]|nr:dUTP diphosphatase [Deltaproteobacteria bacterium]